MTDLPKGWTEVALGDICEFRYGKSLPAAKRSGFGHPVFGSNGQVGAHSTTVTEAPAIVIGRKGSFGEVHWSDQQCWPIDTTYFVDAAATGADLRWLFHRLRRLGLTELNRAAAIPGLNREDAYRKKLLLPPLEEQRRIAAILDKADELRAKRRAALEQLDTLTQAIFLDMFGDPAVNPRGWTVVQIGEVTASTTYGTAQKASSEGAVPVLRMGNLTATGAIDTTDVKFLDGADEKHRLRPGDVLFNRTNSADLVGKTAVFRLPGEWAYAGYLVRLRLTEDAAPDFVGTFMNLPTTKQRLRSMCKAIVGQANINATELQRIPMPLPPRGLQDDFARRLDAVERAKRRAAADECSLDALFASLQSRAFRGEL